VRPFFPLPVIMALLIVGIALMLIGNLVLLVWL